jgi:hypothetical protein
MNRTILLIAMAVAFCSLPANGALITIAIEGVVDSVSDEGDYLEGKIEPGDIMRGFYTYDSSTPDTNPLQKGGRYEHTTGPHGIFLSVGGFDFETDPGNVDFLIEIENDHPPDDNYLLRSNSNLALPNGTPVATISWWLYDPTGNALSSDALPTTSPILNKWQINDLRLETLRVFSIDAHVTTAIPEPSTILLFWLCGLMLVRRNKK